MRDQFVLSGSVVPSSVRFDHSASKPLRGLVGTKDYSELSFRGGHIGIYVSGRAQRDIPQGIHDWLTQRAPAK